VNFAAILIIIISVAIISLNKKVNKKVNKNRQNRNYENKYMNDNITSLTDVKTVVEKEKSEGQYC